jgi:hypothetical protein
MYWLQVATVSQARLLADLPHPPRVSMYRRVQRRTRLAISRLRPGIWRPKQTPLAP